MRIRKICFFCKELKQQEQANNRFKENQTGVWIHCEIKQGPITQGAEQIMNAFEAGFQDGARNYFWKKKTTTKEKKK